MLNRGAQAENRFVWTMVIIILIILAIALYGYLTGAWEQ
jgi:hypothetical protein